jgi:transcriptional regulator with XRE-family HTH domain
MSSQSSASQEAASIIAEVKMISGRRIEERRRLRRMTQDRLAAKAGIGVRWLREIESGNPKSRIDDHLKCAHALGLSGAHLLIPMMFLEHRMPFPRHILDDDMHELEARCIELIASFNLSKILRHQSFRGVDGELPDCRRCG